MCFWALIMFNVEYRVAGIWHVCDSFATLMDACHYASFLINKRGINEYNLQIIDPDGKVL